MEKFLISFRESKEFRDFGVGCVKERLLVNDFKDIIGRRLFGVNNCFILFVVVFILSLKIFFFSKFFNFR